MFQSEQPNYVTDGVGFPSLRSPFDISRATITSLLFKADRHQLEVLCDNYLNHPVNTGYQYRPLLSHVMLPFAHLIGVAYDEAGEPMGLIPEIDLLSFKESGNAKMNKSSW